MVEEGLDIGQMHRHMTPCGAEPRSDAPEHGR
jgi:hypothetical protein